MSAQDTPPGTRTGRTRSAATVLGALLLVTLAVLAGWDGREAADSTQAASPTTTPRASAGPRPVEARPSATAAVTGRPRVAAAKGVTDTRAGQAANARAPQERPRGKAPVIFDVDTKEKVFFITIDDGNVRDEGLRDWLLAKRIPATVFLTKDPGRIDWDYFGSFAAWGTQIQNHSLHHDDLSEMSLQDQQSDICRTSAAFTRHFGHRPTLFRPPYGAYNKDTRRAAARCGITHVVYWTAEFWDGEMVYEPGTDRLHRGDIVLFHFSDNTLDEIRWVIRKAAEHGLRPAPLERYLTH